METVIKPSASTKVVSAPTVKNLPDSLPIVKPLEDAQAVKVAQLKPPHVQKFKPSLTETMQIINDLHTKTRQRNKLEVYHDLLQQFEIDQKAEDLRSDSNYYGCSLVIKDDKRRDFELKHPVIIAEVVGFLMQKFDDKRQEIEAEIILP